jgi:hypothetical protein
MTKVLLCHGRLDIPFKDFGGHVPSTVDYSNLPAIRTHWAEFYQCIRDGLSTEIELDEAVVPMWELNDEFYQTHAQDYDIVFVPHRQRIQFEHLGPDITDRMVFFMQTVFPERFTLDRQGWGANMSFLPLPETDVTSEKLAFFDKLSERTKSNVSKFDQPNLGRAHPKEHYDVLFVCQLPHDETIKYHSHVSVADALAGVLTQAKLKGWTVLVKGHPINPDSMLPLKKITKQYSNAKWTEDISIHEAIKICDIVSMVNSGVGFEAMLHSKPIFTYGRSEYQSVVNYMKTLDKQPVDVIKYASFLYDFLNNHTLDTSDYKQFTKVLNRKIGI